MLVIRPVRESDISALLVLANKVGKGMTSMPSSEEAMGKKIQSSCASFSRPAASLDDFFLTVLEDTSSGKVIGTASVHARTGSRQAFYAYRVMPVTHYSHSLEKQVRSDLLHLTNDYTDCSEVGSLFVDPDHRGNGRWLAASRYLLMGEFPERFAKYVIAELRGIIDDHDKSPFWEAIGKQFFQMEYEHADALCGTGSNQFITELMPKHPIYACLLPAEARAAIGAPNKDSRRAMDFLLEEGYDFENVVDIFDGGPILRAKVENLKSVRNIVEGKANIVDADIAGEERIVANVSLANFRVIKTAITVNPENEISISASAAKALEVDTGDALKIIKQ